ncbi:MAG: ketoacyl-ACP synthase III [Rhodospirillaceae bacterium]|nr:ketoacyl-ACP synthase III [Rhodospirillaceae bacterium]
MVSRIIGTGSHLPEKVITNEELSKKLDTSDEWIVDRTGIKERRVAKEGETTSIIAFQAAENALDAAGITADGIDVIIMATTTPDNTFPSTATKVQAMLGMNHGYAFDIQAVCSGFIYALSIADGMIRAGQAKRILVIGAEVVSRILDWTDRSTCVLFGDGAGAVVLEGFDAGDGDDSGILSTHLHSDGRLREVLYVDGGPGSTGTIGHLRMLGREVFRHAVTNLAAVAEEALTANNLTTKDIDWLVPHQANKRILDGTAKKLGLSEDQVVITVDRHANTSAASIPLALDEAVRDGRIQKGQIILMEAMGGGLTWGSALVRW